MAHKQRLLLTQPVKTVSKPNVAMPVFGLVAGLTAVAQVAWADTAKSTAPATVPVRVDMATPAIAPMFEVPAAPRAQPASQPAAQPATDPARIQMLAKDLNDLAEMLSGRWDNELQTFFEPELNVPVARRHERVHAIIRPFDGAPPEGFGTRALYVEHRRGGEGGAIARQRVWTLTTDPSVDGVRMVLLAPKDGKPLEAAWKDPAKLSGLKLADFTPVTGCDVIWKRQADGFAGDTRPAACKLVNTADQKVLTVSEHHDLSNGVWDVRDIGVDERGTRVFGLPDGAPTRLRKAHGFVCWAGARSGSGFVTDQDLVLHDQGGTARADLPGASPASLRVRLRNVDWPVGNNRPSLTLYLLVDGDEKAEAFAWSDPDARRIALDLGGMQASCTRDPNAIWR